MRREFLVLGASTLMLAACTATGNEGEQALGPGTVMTADGTELRCEIIRETGSRMSNRICLTEREWAQMEENAQQARRDRDEQHTVALRGQGGFGGPD